MADVITFDCTSCGLPYKVAASYAGREFACKKCGARLCVPKPGQQAAFEVKPEVEMDSGSEVMRRMTPSGRSVAVDPTRVFTRERETSQRMAAVSGPAQKKSGGSGLLIGAIVAGVVLLGGGAATVFLLLGKESAAPEAGNGTRVAVDTPSAAEPSERDRLMARLDEGLDAAGLLTLREEAAGKVEPDDMTVINQRLVRALTSEQGGNLSDARLMEIAAGFEQAKSRADAERVYTVLLHRHKQTDPRPEVYTEARRRLGYVRLDIPAQLERATALLATGVVDGMQEVKDSLQEIETRLDDGWSTADDKARFEQAVSALDDAEAAVENIRKTDPFRFKLATARAEFSKEKASGIGNWVSFGRDPYVIFVQLLTGEDEAAAAARLDDALSAAEQFPEFFNTELRDALDLKRTLPSSLPADKREDAPIVIKLFRNASYWRAYLRDHGYGDVDTTRARTFTQPGTGHVSMVYDQEEPGRTTKLATFVRALIDVSLYNYHPHAPTTLEEDESFRAYNAFILEYWLHNAILVTSRNRQTGEYTFWNDDPRFARTLNTWRKPFAKDPNDRFNSIGGQVFMVRDLVKATDLTSLRTVVSEKIATFEGWSEGDLLVGRQTANLDAVTQGYLRGLYQFLWHWGPDDSPKYRAKFQKFIRMDLAGEVNKDDPLPAFEKAFGLDEAAWKELEADFTTYQTLD